MRLSWPSAPVWAALAVCFAAQTTATASADTRTTFPFSIYVAHPFPDSNALNAFQTYIAKQELVNRTKIVIPDEFWVVAPKINYWGYTFVQNQDQTVDVIFEQRFSIVDLISDIRKAVYSLNSSACSDFYIDNFAITSITRRWIAFYGHGSGEKRACGDWPWGGSWSTDIAGYSATVTGRVGFATQVPSSTGQFRGIMIPLPPAVSIDVDLNSIVGVGTNTVVGQLLTGITQLSIAPLVISPVTVPVWELISQINRTVGKREGSEILGADYLDGTDGQVISAKYRNFLMAIMNMTWSLQPNWVIDDTLSGLDGSADNLELVVAFRTSIVSASNPFFELAVESAQGEIALLKSFSQQPRAIVVKRGDSLWRLAQAYYSKPFFHQALGYFNGMSGKHGNKLLVGNVLAIPPLYELALMGNVHLVLPGETIAGLCKRVANVLEIKTCMDDFKRANANVNLNKLFALQPIMLPQSWPSNPPLSGGVQGAESTHPS